jgi:hypothetical protein
LKEKRQIDDWARLRDGALSDFEQAKAFTHRANADLAKELATIPGCTKALHDELNKLLADQKREDDARALINTWRTTATCT